MTRAGPFDDIPIACTLPTIAEARAQVDRWRAFDADYALSADHTDTQLTLHYAKVDDCAISSPSSGVAAPSWTGVSTKTTTTCD